MLSNCTIVLLGTTLASASLAVANPTDRFATWDNGGSGTLWSTADNWDPDFAPLNFASFDFFVTIPGTSFTVDYDLPDMVTLTGLTVNANSRLNLGADGDLTIGTETHPDSMMHFGGILDSNGTNFNATLGDVAFIGNRARVFVSGGGIVTIGVPSYDSRGLWADNHSGSTTTYNWPLLDSVGAGSFLDLSTVTDINAGFNSSGNDNDYQKITASNGGVIDLSGVEIVTAPSDGQDRIEFILIDPDSRIHLDSLHTLTSASAGDNRFDLKANTTMDLPVLSNVRRADFILGAGAQLTAPVISDIDYATFHVFDGAQFHGRGVPGTYDSRALWADNNSGSTTTYNWTLMQSGGVGSVLDLSTVTDISAGFTSTGNDNDYQKITASNGGVIDLSGVEMVTAPTAGQDRIEFILIDPDSRIHLDSLHTLTSASAGDNRFDLQADTTMDLPVLSNVRRADFILGAGAQVTAPVISDIDHSTFSLAGGARFDGGGVPGTYDSRSLWADNNSGSTTTYNWTLMQSSGAGALLDLSTVTDINTGFNSSGNDNDYQKINALNEGMLDLSDVQKITTPSDGQDRLELNISGGGTADMSSLSEIVSAGSGPLHINLDTGGVLTTGGWATVSATTRVIIDNEDPVHGGPPTTLHVLGDLAASGTVDITLTHPNTRLDVDGDLNVTSNIDLVAANGGTVTVGGNLTYGFTNEDDLKLGCATVHFDSEGRGKQHYELGGFDVDVFVEFLPEGDHNFGLGQMVVGRPDQSTVVQLEDLSDNGNRGGAAEVLYLWGNYLCETAPPEGLRIQGGSTLSLDGLNLYVYNFDPQVPGEWVHVNTVFPEGINTIPYDDGFISLNAFPLDLLFDPPVLIEQIEEPTSAAAADIDGVNNDDLAITVLGPTKGANGDLVVLLNDGTGLVYTRQDTEVGTDPSDVVLADFNGGNGPDAAVTDATANNVTILLNDGQGMGGFDDPVTVDVGAAPSAVAAGDLDGTNGPDLAVANEGGNSVSILTNDGSGGFTVSATLEDNIAAPRDVAIGEFDGNPGLDVSIASAGSDTIVLYVNDGSGALSFGGEFGLGQGPGVIDPADLDNDKDLDQVVSSTEAGETQNLLNDGTGNFTVVPLPAANGADPTSLATDDLDDDGDIDILVVAGAGETRAIGVLRNDLIPGQQLSFSRVLNLAPDPMLRFTLAAPLNDDALPDIVAIQAIAEGLRGGGAVKVLLNVSGLGLPCPCDFNGDGDVGFFEVLRILAEWGNPGGPEDCDGNGTVGFGDVLEVLAGWGPCPT